MNTSKTTLDEILNLSPYLKSRKMEKDVVAYMNELINAGYQASEVIHTTERWLANLKKNPDDLKKQNTNINHKVKLNIGSTIKLDNPHPVPPYRRGMGSIRQPKQALPAPLDKTIDETTELQQWLIAIGGLESKNFSDWCAKLGKVVCRELWDDYLLFKNSQNEKEIETQDFEERSFVEDRKGVTKIRIFQKEFREDVLRNWGGRCAITNTPFAVEACHIVSHACGGAPNVENGIALAADLHFLLDNGHLKLVNNQVLFSEEARKDVRYSDYHGDSLRDPIRKINIANS